MYNKQNGKRNKVFTKKDTKVFEEIVYATCISYGTFMAVGVVYLLFTTW